jgi:hypothetical protein
MCEMFAIVLRDINNNTKVINKLIMSARSQKASIRAMGVISSIAIACAVIARSEVKEQAAKIDKLSKKVEELRMEGD